MLIALSILHITPNHRYHHITHGSTFNLSITCFVPSIQIYNSLEAKHPILVWIMKVKGPKNQADFIEVLYVVVKIAHRFLGPRNAQIFSLNNAQILIWPPDYNIRRAISHWLGSGLGSENPEPSLQCEQTSAQISDPSCTLSEEIAHSTVYHHLGQLSVDIQLSGLIKFRED